MKQFLAFAAAAMMVFAGCQKSEVVYDNANPQEIDFSVVTNVTTKTPVTGTAFLDDDNMNVAAYLVSGATAAGNFFAGTPFVNKAGLIWHGNPARYWPITTSTINFLAVTETGGGIDKTTVAFGAPDYASEAEVTLADNNAYNQNDVMFAAGTGTHTEGGAYNAVPMVFKHALAWVNFTVATNTHNATLTVNAITLNKASYNGTLNLTNAQYSSTTANTTAAVTAAWETPTTPVDEMKVPNADGDAAADAVTLTTAAKTFGNGLLVIPDGGAESFTINYTLTQEDGTELTYNYKHTFTPYPSWKMAKKYTYNITINLTEIEVEPTITDWDPEAGSGVTLK